MAALPKATQAPVGLTLSAMCLGLFFAPRLNSLGQSFKNLLAVCPTDASIRDALGILQSVHIVFAGCEFLRTTFNVTFYHHSEDLTRAFAHLRSNFLRHHQLAFMLLAAVGMAAINHQGGGQFGGRQILAGSIHTGLVVIGHFTAAQNHMAIGIALRLHNGHLTVLVN